MGKPVQLLENEYYDYKLSEDANEHCICSLTKKPCMGRVLGDFDEQSSGFFSRDKCMMSRERLNNCPIYGAPREAFELIFKKRLEDAKREIEEKLVNFK